MRMTEKYINIDLNDPRSGKIAEVISNKTSKRILGLIAEREMSATEIANELGLPLNTATYNIEKLVDSGLIEKVKGFLWSTRGKKIEKYKIANKKIVISPRTMMKGIIPAILGVGVISFILKLLSDNQSNTSNYVRTAAMDKAVSGASGVVSEAASELITRPEPASTGVVSNICSSFNSLSGEVWAWFLLGALVAILIYLIFNRIERRYK